MFLVCCICVSLSVIGINGVSEQQWFTNLDEHVDSDYKERADDEFSYMSVLKDIDLEHHDDNIDGRKEHRRKRRYVQETMDEVVTNLVEEVEILKENIRLLEKDNAMFQQTVATVTKITDDRLSSYSCSCLKYILRDEGIFPCELVTPISPVNPINPVKPPTNVSEQPTIESTTAFVPDSLEYLDSPMPEPLVPSLLCVSYYGNNFFRYVFANSSVDIIQEERKVTHAVTFDSEDERIIWSSFTPAVVYSSKIDGSNLTTLITDVLSYGLEVDIEQRLLFLTTVTPRHAVAVKNLAGEGYEVIANVGSYGRPTRLSLDTKNESIYVAFRARILKMNYDGSQQSVFVRGKFITTLSYDRINDILYFADRITILRVLDTKSDVGKSELLKKFKPKTGSFPSDIFVDNDNLFIGYKFKPDVEVMSVTNLTLTKIAHVDGDYVSLTLIR